MRKLVFFLTALFLVFKISCVEAAIPFKDSFAPLVKKSGPAVVNIYTKRMVKERVRSANPFLNDPFFNQFFQMPMGGGMVQERMQSSLGSGVIVGEDGTIATSNHVVKDAAEIRIVTSDGQEFDAKKLLEDPRTDLAVLKIDTKGKSLPFLNIADSDEVEVGDIVLAIGNPFGVGQTVTSGIVSGVARTDVGITDYGSFIQTDAAINPGNSGGALIDVNGDLIGINTAIYSRDGGSLGIGFAIPANMVKSVLKVAKSGGKIARPWVGVSSQPVTADMLESLGLDRVKGALIKKVYPDSPADKAGIVVGDVVVAINGKEVLDPSALKFRLATVEIGSDIQMDILRKGSKVSVELEAQVPPEKPARDETLIEGASLFSGAVVANISPALLEELGDSLVKESGVVILAIKGGNSARLGLQPGDVVLSINGEAVSSVKFLAKYLESKDLTRWSAVIQRGKKTINLTIAR